MLCTLMIIYYKVKINYESTTFCLLVDIAILIEFDDWMGAPFIRASEIMFVFVAISKQANTILNTIQLKWKEF